MCRPRRSGGRELERREKSWLDRFTVGRFYGWTACFGKSLRPEVDRPTVQPINRRTAAAINRDGELMLTLSDGSVLTPGRVAAAKRA